MCEQSDEELWRMFLKEWYAVYREVCRIEMTDPSRPDLAAFCPLAWERFEAVYESYRHRPRDFMHCLTQLRISACRYELSVPAALFKDWLSNQTNSTSLKRMQDAE